MNLIDTRGMVKWKLKETMDKYGVTRYKLQKESKLAMNTIREMYDGNTRRPDLDNLDRLVATLRKLTGAALGLNDVLEWEES